MEIDASHPLYEQRARGDELVTKFQPHRPSEPLPNLGLRVNLCYHEICNVTLC